MSWYDDWKDDQEALHDNTELDHLASNLIEVVYKKKDKPSKIRRKIFKRKDNC